MFFKFEFSAFVLISLAFVAFTFLKLLSTAVHDISLLAWTVHGIATKLANPIRTRMIAEARIKNDKLDARILADLLKGDLVAESYVPSKREREWRALVRHRASLVRTSTDVKNRVQSLLDKYELRPKFSDLFGKRGPNSILLKSAGTRSRTSYLQTSFTQHSGR